MLTSIEKHFPLIPFYCFFLVLTLLSLDHIFFWDTVQLASMQAHHFFENGLNNTLLPNKIDSGHIPAFGFYLAILWKIFGKTLWVSHLAILPFLLGIVWQSNTLIRYFIPKPYATLSLILFLAEPTLLGQSVLVSPDIVLVFCFLLMLNGILKNQRFLIAIGLIGLFLISMRGLMVAFSLLLFDIYLNAFDERRLSFSQLLKISLAYWPAVIGILPYFLFHYAEKGWLAYHPDSPWMGSFERVGIEGFLYNIGIMIWRIMDFGRVFVIIAIVLITLTRLGKIRLHKKFKYLIFMMASLVICLGYSFTTYKYLSAHRYLLPLYLILLLGFLYMLFVFVSNKRVQNIIYLIVFGALLSGHLWIYPEGIAKGWDSSLAHWPYYELREKMNAYLEQKDIAYSEVASEFPNVSERRFMELNESHEKHQYFNLDSNDYVLYSNVYNNFNDEEINQLKRNFKPIQSFEKRGVFMSLYKKEKTEK